MMMGDSVFYHGTKHPYVVGDLVVPGLVHPGVDDRLMVFASESFSPAHRSAHKRRCGCDQYRDETHRARVFVVSLDDPEPDPNGWLGAACNYMGSNAHVLREVDPDDFAALLREEVG